MNQDSKIGISITIVITSITLFMVLFGFNLIIDLQYAQLEQEKYNIIKAMNFLELVNDVNMYVFEGQGFSGSDWNNTCKCFDHGWETYESEGITWYPNETVEKYPLTMKTHRTMSGYDYQLYLDAKTDLQTKLDHTQVVMSKLTQSKDGQ